MSPLMRQLTNCKSLEIVESPKTDKTNIYLEDFGPGGCLMKNGDTIVLNEAATWLYIISFIHLLSISCPSATNFRRHFCIISLNQAQTHLNHFKVLDDF